MKIRKTDFKCVLEITSGITTIRLDVDELSSESIDLDDYPWAYDVLKEIESKIHSISTVPVEFWKKGQEADKMSVKSLIERRKIPRRGEEMTLKQSMEKIQELELLLKHRNIDLSNALDSIQRLKIGIKRLRDKSWDKEG